jgi:hypothetical protein
MTKQLLSRIIVHLVLAGTDKQNELSIQYINLHKLKHKELKQLQTLASQYCAASHKIASLASKLI